MDISHVVDSDPERLGGAVCFTGTRVPVRNLFDYLAEGHAREAFLDDYPRVDRAAALAVLEFAADSVEDKEVGLAGRLSQHCNVQRFRR